MVSVSLQFWESTNNKSWTIQETLAKNIKEDIVFLFLKKDEHSKCVFKMDCFRNTGLASADFRPQTMYKTNTQIKNTHFFPSSFSFKPLFCLLLKITY